MRHKLDDLVRLLGAMALCAPVGCGGVEPERADRAVDGFDLLEVTAARAFPADDATLTSPYAVSIDPCQRSFHVAFNPGSVDEDLESLYRDASAPVLAMSDGDDEVRFENGRFLLESVRFDLDPEVLESMSPGVWSADVLVDDEVIAHIDEVAKLATGDANRDGEVNSSDLQTVYAAGRYETGEAAGYDAGDFNCDGEFGTGDLVEMASAKEGVTYESGRYAALPSPTNGETGEQLRYIVSDYRCWLSSYATPQAVTTTEPEVEAHDGESEEDRAAREQRLRERTTYSDMKVQRTCSASAYDPDGETNESTNDSVFVDPRVASYVHSECDHGGTMLDETNELLGEIGETYQWGEATITAKGNVMRDVWMVCEPRYTEVVAHETSQGRFEVDVPRMDDNDVCSIELAATARGEVRATAHGGWAEAPGFIQSDVAVKATARSTMELYFPNLGDLSKDDGGTPGGRVIVGTASAESPATPDRDDWDNVKCRASVVGASIWNPLGGLKTSVTCFWEVTGADVVDLLSGGDPNPVVQDQKHAEARTYLGWARPDEEGKPDYSRAVNDRGTLKLFPTKDGPFEKNLGKLRVYAEQEAMSSSHASHIEYDEYEIIASEGYANGNTGSITLSIEAPYPEPPDEYEEWTLEEQLAWEESHYQHCHIPSVNRDYDDVEPVLNEPDQNGDKIVERGHSVSVGVADFDRRYWIGRDGFIESFLERFGAW